MQLKCFDKFELPPSEIVPVLKSLTAAQRLATAFHLSKLVRSTIRAQIYSQHPKWSDIEVEAELARRISHATE